jgi:hypothetical protein
MVPSLGVMLNSSNEQARTLLGWTPRSGKDAILAAVQSLLDPRLIGTKSLRPIRRIASGRSCALTGILCRQALPADVRWTTASTTNGKIGLRRFSGRATSRRRTGALKDH